MIEIAAKALPLISLLYFDRVSAELIYFDIVPKLHLYGHTYIDTYHITRLPLTRSIRFACRSAPLASIFIFLIVETTRRVVSFTTSAKLIFSYPQNFPFARPGSAKPRRTFYKNKSRLQVCLHFRR